MIGTKSALTVLLAVTLIVPAAFAQFPGGRGGGRGTGGAQAAQGLDKARDRPAADTSSFSSAPVLVQLDKLEDELKLTPQQRAAWNAYADRVLQLADEITRSRFPASASPQPAGATAATKLDQLTSSARNRLTAVEEIVEAGKAFYATLTPAQKTIADRALVLPLLPLAAGASPPATARASSNN